MKGRLAREEARILFEEEVKSISFASKEFLSTIPAENGATQH